MLQSMTGFASGQGQDGGFAWSWDLRCVNARGRDLRLRLPDWIEGLEAVLRTRLAGAVTRGNVTLGLRVQGQEAGSALALDPGQLAATLDALAEVEAQAMARGITLAPANAAAVLGLRGVMEPGRAEADIPRLRAALDADFEGVLAAFLEMRAREGAALARLIAGHLDEIEAQLARAEGAAQARAPAAAAALRAALARVMENSEGMDEARIAQELALIAVKGDVTEEIDRLRAHVAAARAMLSDPAPAGRKLDFLAQEFNREANTLCSKAQDAALTAAGLDLKSTIEQLREQVQNVE